MSRHAHLRTCRSEISTRAPTFSARNLSRNCSQMRGESRRPYKAFFRWQTLPPGLLDLPQPNFPVCISSGRSGRSMYKSVFPQGALM
jgi:hypothetical protein